MIRRRRPRQRLALTAGALACSLVLAACGSTADTASEPAVGRPVG